MAKNEKPKTQPSPTVSTKKSNIDLIIMGFLFVVSFLLYANTLGHEFVLDDPLAISLNDNVTQGVGGIGDIIKGGYRENNFGGKLYRPVSLVQFAMEWSMSPNNPFIHHLFNVLWFSVCVVFVFMVLRRWFSAQNILLPMIVALIFAAHPIHTEVVANIKSRDEIMSLVCILGAFIFWDRYMKEGKLSSVILSIAIYFLALLSKESAVTMFPIFGLLSWYVYGQTAAKSAIGGLVFLVPVALMFMIRFAIFGSSPAVPVDIMDNPIVAASGMIEHLATSILILGKYFYLQILPWPLSSDYSYQVIPLVGFNDVKVWLSLLIHLSMVVLAIIGWKRRQFLSLAIIAYFMSISLYSQIPVVIGTMFGERLAFLPSFWLWCGLVFGVLSTLKVDMKEMINGFSNVRGNTKFVSILVLIIASMYGGLTISRNGDWKNNFNLFTTDSGTYPQSVRLHNGAADQWINAASAEGLDANTVADYYAKAEDHCQQILKIRPVATAYLSLGNIRLKQKRYEDAIVFYDQVNDLKNIVDTNKALAYREMARNAGEKEQNLAKAGTLLTQSISLNDKDPETWFLKGVLAGIQNNHLEAAVNFEKAFALNKSPEYAKNVITAYQNLGNAAKVAEYQQYVK